MKENELPKSESPLPLKALFKLGLAVSLIASPPVIGAQWEAFESYRLAPLSVPSTGSDGFTSMVPTDAGIPFTNRLAASTSLTNQIYLNGAGVAIADVDGDDLNDIYFCGLESDNQLYRNQGNWQFKADTQQTLLACSDQASTGAAFADVDGDGDPDLLVNGIRRGTRLFLNDGTGSFSEATDDWGLRNQRGSASMTLADVNGDGWLDLYVVNYRNVTMRDEPDSPFDVRVKDGKYTLVSYRGRPGTDEDLVGRFSFGRESGVMENGQADRLFLNQGGFEFEPVAWDEGIFMSSEGQTMSPPYDWGLSAMFRDLNDDGWVDLYVCNDFQSPDRIWINDGSGSFRPIRESAIRQTSLFSMGVDVADINRDGYPDLFVADMLSRVHEDRHVQVMDGMAFAQYRNVASQRPQSPRNTLLLNRGNGDYAEIARFAGLDASYWSWCPVFMDVDLDGFEDLLVTTGHGRDAQNVDISREIDSIVKQQSLSPEQQLQLRSRYPLLETPNVAFRNRRDLRFEDKSESWGFDSTRITHGMSLADLDNDGDQDLIATCLNAAPLLYRNDTAKPRIRVRLRPQTPNTRGIGAKITVRSPGMPAQSQEMIAGGRYLSSDEPSRVFALASHESEATVEVRWQDGSKTIVTGVPANHLLEIQDTNLVEGDDTTEGHRGSPLFKDVSTDLPHRHEDEPYDDYTIQSTLSSKLSERGPGISWFDFNGDGWEDLFIGAGRGGKIGVFRNARDGSFVRQKAQAFASPVRRDQTTILGWIPSDKDRQLLIGQSNYEDAVPNGPGIWQFSVMTGKGNQALVRNDGSIGPMTMGDADGDGDLDLFIGGSQPLGRYPFSAPSVLLVNNKGQFTAGNQKPGLPDNLGSIRSATFTHLDEDRFPELAVVGEWMAIRIFRNKSGRYEEWNPVLRWGKESALESKPKKLSDMTGLWNSIRSADLDGDGRMDLIAGNAGVNRALTPGTSGSQRIYYEAMTPRGVRTIEAYFDSTRSAWLPQQDWGLVGVSFPELRNHYAGFKAFSRATMADLFKAGLPEMAHKGADFFYSVVLLNRGDHFEGRVLPPEAQFSPIFGLATGDFDLDGHSDVLLAQNSFSTRSLFGRHDAGGLLLLRGNGKGELIAVKPNDSGLTTYSQGRGLAVCDFNHDGRLDFVSGQHGQRTKAYLNQSKRAGIRVMLRGGPANRQAIGTRMRLGYEDDVYGPMSEVALGSGYWSQDATTKVLGFSVPPRRLQIIWPNGRNESIPLKAPYNTIARQMPN